MKKYILFVLLIPLISCVTFHPPENHNIIKSKTFNKDYDFIWGRIIDWFGENNIPIKNMDKNSGFISTERQLSIDDIYCDCGIIERAAVTEIVSKVYKKGITANFNIISRKISDSLTKVDINIFFHCTQELYTYTGSLAERREIDCTSLGLIEKTIFQYLEQSQSSK
jgi:hypothetical protein